MLIATWVNDNKELDWLIYNSERDLKKAMLNGDWDRLPANIVQLSNSGYFVREYRLVIEEVDYA
tara:strand:- start:352 stop:543 length:192 start_codon:yes stop_codon:yes gene_type:complete